LLRKSKMETTRPIVPLFHQPFTTERLLIRPYAPSDAEDMFILRSQPEVMIWTSSKVPDVDIEKTRRWMAAALPPWNGDGFSFAIEERSSPGRVIGVIGTRFREPPECGYMFRTETWGKGFATEALRAWLDVYWGLPRRKVTLDREDGPASEDERLLAETALANAGSRKVLVKCGFTELRRWEEDGTQLIQYICRSPA
jgi:RimJ/RimL family protein N-acetyltransferase